MIRQPLWERRSDFRNNLCFPDTLGVAVRGLFLYCLPQKILIYQKYPLSCSQENGVRGSGTSAPFAQEFNPVASQQVLEDVICDTGHLTISQAPGSKVLELPPPFTQEFNPVTCQNVLKCVICITGRLTIS